jgi:hypothetical protein
MAQISDYVSVTVTRGSRPITTAGFGIPMFLAQVNFYGASEEHKIYSDVVSMTTDGFPTNHPAVVWATDVFAQTQKPNSIVIGRQDYTSYDVTPTPADDTDFTVEIGILGFTTSFVFTSGTSATATQIVDGLKALIDGDSNYTGVITATNVADELVIAPVAGQETFVNAITSNLVRVTNGAEDVDVALASVTAAHNEYFFLAGQSQSDADMKKFAAFAQANDKMYFGSIPLSMSGLGAGADTGFDLKALQYDNTQTVYRNDANLEEYASGALIGSMAATNPGTSIWFGKTLQGVTAESFTGTQENDIAGVNSNYYPLVAGVGFYTDGVQASGEFGDTIRFSLWLKARIAEAVFGLLKRQSDLGLKVPHDERGYAMVRQVIQNDVLALGVSRGAISTAKDGAVDPTVRTLARDEVPTNDRAARILPDVVVDLVYSGAVQDVRIRVYVTV